MGGAAAVRRVAGSQSVRCISWGEQAPDQKANRDYYLGGRAGFVNGVWLTKLWFLASVTHCDRLGVLKNNVITG